MIIVRDVINQEILRNNNLIQYYEKIINDSPKGSIDVREISNEKYLYLKYRENGKVVTKYCGKVDECIYLIDLIDKRNHAKNILKKLKNERKVLERMCSLL